ncbi:MAG: hypothetical protein IKZ31_02185 [Lentisphaeria bacterium]|nr:hypothetical protein [Lentisphaeria bacterium]
MAVILSSLQATAAMQEQEFRGIRPDDVHGRMAIYNPERGWRTEFYAGELPDAGLRGVCSVHGAIQYNYLGETGFKNRIWQDELDSLRYDGVSIVQSYLYLTSYIGGPLP